MTHALPLVALVAALVLAGALGAGWRSRQGKVQFVAPAATAGTAPPAELAGHGIGQGQPVVLHFSAEWCAPCKAARTVIRSIVAEDGSAREVELDLDEHAQLARTLGVLSLPTTFVYDGAGALKARIAGVPKAEPLRDVLRTYAE